MIWVPKARSDQVITHRIELQETERATLEAALAGRFVTNSVGALGSVFSGIGAALVPFSGAFTALTALWIADKSFDELKVLAEAVRDEAVEHFFPQLGNAEEQYSFIVGWLEAQHSNNGYNSVMSNSYEVTDHLESEGAYPFLITRFREFINWVSQLYQDRHSTDPDPLAPNPGGRRWHDFISQPPQRRWLGFYPLTAYAQEIKEATYRQMDPLGIFT